MNVHSLFAELAGHQRLVSLRAENLRTARVELFFLEK
jgi:hypothetical protein